MFFGFDNGAKIHKISIKNQNKWFYFNIFLISDIADYQVIVNLNRNILKSNLKTTLNKRHFKIQF